MDANSKEKSTYITPLSVAYIRRIISDPSSFGIFALTFTSLSCIWYTYLPCLLFSLQENSRESLLEFSSDFKKSLYEKGSSLYSIIRWACAFDNALGSGLRKEGYKNALVKSAFRLQGNDIIYNTFWYHGFLRFHLLDRLLWANISPESPTHLDSLPCMNIGINEEREQPTDSALQLMDKLTNSVTEMEVLLSEAWLSLFRNTFNSSTGSLDIEKDSCGNIESTVQALSRLISANTKVKHAQNIIVNFAMAALGLVALNHLVCLYLSFCAHHTHYTQIV